MTLDDLASFIHQEGRWTGTRGAAAEPSAGMGTAGVFRGLEGGFGIGMGNPSAGVLWLLCGPSREITRPIIARGPDVVRDLSGRRWQRYGTLRLHSGQFSQ